MNDYDPSSDTRISQLEAENARLQRELDEARRRPFHDLTLELLVEHGSDVVSVLDPSGRILEIGGACERVFGWKPAELVGKRPSELAHPDDRVRLSAALPAILRTGEGRAEYRARCADGSERWVETAVRLVRLPGAPRRIVGFTRDITARHEAERQLRQNQRLLDAILEGSTDGIFVKDLEGRYLLINQAAIRTHGRTVEEALGRTDRELLQPDIAEEVHRQDREVIGTGSTLHYDERNVVSGRRYAWSTTKGVVRDEHGEICGIFGISRDVTASADTAEALRHNEEQLRLMLDHAPIGMVLAAPDGTILRVNSRFCEFVGRERFELLGHDFRMFSHPDDAATNRAQLAMLVRGDVARYEAERRYLRPDGTVVHGLLSASLLRDTSGAPLHVVGQVVDITERKRAEQALREHTEQLRVLALLDELPGLYNRRGFLSLAEQQLAAARRLGRKVVLLFADLDGLKPINDRFGHEAGDRAIAAAAALMRSTFRSSDVVARVGGDEFAVAAMEMSPPGATTLVRRLEDAVALHNGTTSEPWRLSISVGTVECDPSALRPLVELLQEADEAMYAQKRGRHATRQSS